MSNEIKVYRNRHNTIPVSCGLDITGDTITSEIRSEPFVSAPSIATWVVTVTDAVNGKFQIDMDEVVSGQIQAASGFMDFKRVSGGIAYPLGNGPIEVTIIGAVTA